MSWIAVAICVALGADEGFSPEKAATIAHEQQKAAAAVGAKFGNRKPTELSAEERQAYAKERAAAERQVLDQHGVTLKEWTRGQAKRSREEVTQQQAVQRQLVEKDKAAAAAAANAPKADVQVQRGFSEDRPVTLDEKFEEGQVVIERELPDEVLQDQAEAQELDRLEGASEAPAAPAKKPGRHK